MSEQRTSLDPRESTIAWFLVLERARLDNDFERAAEAQRELRRLGVKIEFDKQCLKGEQL